MSNSAKDTQKIDERLKKKPAVNRTKSAQTKSGQIVGLDSVIADSAMITADQANHFLMQQAGQVKVAGEQFAEAIYQLSENVPNIFAQSALNRLNELTDGNKTRSRVTGWQYESKMNVDFNSALEQALTVGDEKPMLTGTAQY